MAEIRSTLSYPRIRRKYPLTDDDVDRLVTLLEQDALVVPGEIDARRIAYLCARQYLTQP